ncbi:MAG: biotin--[acetyl-CoA-carboxylase] ligase, partial [Actinomycetota bacterium]
MTDRWNPILEHFSSLPSTNTLAGDRAAAGAPAGLTLVADFQTAGRGRLDRSWEAPPKSSLLCSVLLRPTLPPSLLHLATIAMALSARAAVRVVTGVAPELKWPNDVLLSGRKFGGILAEAHLDAPGGPPNSIAVVVGIGINLTFDGPPEANATSLQTSTGQTIDRDLLLDALLEALGPRQGLLDTVEGRADLMTEYREALSTIGQLVAVHLPNGAQHGEAVGV